MKMTPSQQTALKADIAANTNQVMFNGQLTNINAIPFGDDGNPVIAAWYNQTTASYFVWRTSVTRSMVYHTLSPDGTVWDWAAYKAQSVTEQGAWVQMFMGDVAPFDNLNFRNGVFNIFSGSAPQNAQRAHIFSIGRRLATNIEKLFSSAPVNAGGITVSVSNGNTVAQPLGSALNPAVMSFEGKVTAADISLLP